MAYIDLHCRIKEKSYLKYISPKLMNATMQNPLKRKKAKHAPQKSNSELLPRIYDLEISRKNPKHSEGVAIPNRISLVYLSEVNHSLNTLYIDRTPVPNSIWSYDLNGHVLRWNGIYGGGELRITPDQKGGYGVVGVDSKTVSVKAGAKVAFRCEAAQFNCEDDEDCPITEEGDQAVTKLNWHPEKDGWKNACWQSDRLLLTYVSHQDDPDGPYLLDFSFKDLGTCNSNGDCQTWVVGENGSSGEGRLSMGLNDEGYPKILVHFEGIPVPLIPSTPAIPPSDLDCQEGQNIPISVWPVFMDAEEDNSSVAIQGAMHTVLPYPNSVKVGFTGIREFPTVTGYYRSKKSDTVFGVFDGNIEVNGEVVARGEVYNKTLFWKGLSPENQRLLRLPAQGRVRFDPTGRFSAGRHQPIQIERLAAGEAIRLLTDADSHHPAISKSCKSFSEKSASGDLGMGELNQMTPFKKDADGNLYDYIQELVMNDTFDIIVDAIPQDLWNSLFSASGYTKEPLTGEVAMISTKATPDYPNPRVWYESLSTAVLTSGMAEGDNENCRLMNGPRANQWLREEVPNSDVYQIHGQYLFALRWPEHSKNVNTQLYLDDQALGTQAQVNTINTWREAEKLDIDTNVIDEEDENGLSVTQQLKDIVDECADYAIDNNLYWAFKFFAYHTQTSVLGSMEGMIANTEDNTLLQQFFQNNSSTLTALDPTGFFAKQYNRMFNTFLEESIINSMYGFDKDAADFSIMWEYLSDFVEEYKESTETPLKDMAETIDELLNDERAQEIIQYGIDLFFEISEMVWYHRNLDWIGQIWPTLFGREFPDYIANANKIGTMLATGLSVASTLNMVMYYKAWDELDELERAELVMGTIQRAVQITGSLAKGTVTMGSIFKIEGMTKWERVKCASKAFVGMENGDLTDAMTNIGNSMAQWVGDTYGTYSERQKWASLTPTAQDIEVKKKSMTKKLMGRNLDEFLATRVGPVMVLGGIGLSIANIAAGDTGVKLAIDIMEIVAGALELFAMVGGYLLEVGVIAAEGIAATMIACAGPLAIVGAIAGICLLLYQRFHKEPDPVEDFVNNEVASAGFKVRSRCSAIDYTKPYVDDNDENMVGFSLQTGGNFLVAGTDGNVSLGELTETPATVWVAATSGTGMSEIAVVEKWDEIEITSGWLLSLMNDGTVRFHERVDLSQIQDGAGGPTVRSQMWYSTALSDAITNGSDTYLVSMDVNFAALIPDANGEYDAERTDGNLVATSNGITWKNDGSVTTFNLAMQHMAPNFLFMPDLNFLDGVTPYGFLKFGPSFGINPSSPMTFSVSPALPSYLSLSPSQGTISIVPDEIVSGAAEASYTFRAENDQGVEEVPFSIKIKTPSFTLTF